MNRIDELFKQKNNKILSVFFTAGHPELNNTVEIIQSLERNGVDMIEIGVPFSDPLADGPVIQKSGLKALSNGMSLKVLFEQLKDIRKTVKIPLLLMGYINPVMRYGVEAFCASCEEVGIDGVILPDLPYSEYNLHYKELFAKHKLHNIFLITPQTNSERLAEIDKAASGFIYMVSTSATTGSSKTFAPEVTEYFQRICNAKLKNPTVIGFGIKDKETFDLATQYANGAIIGTAFVNALDKEGSIEEKVKNFVQAVI